jgi:hypothetical protein
MKKFFLVLPLALLLSGCLGYSQKDGEAVGQAKKVSSATPLICPDYFVLDISLGVMRNGVGSMSQQDMLFTVQDAGDLQKMKDAVANGSLVRVKYDTVRFPICVEDHVVTGFEIVR